MPQNPQRLKAARVLEALHIGQAVMVDGMKLVMIDGQIFIEAQAYRYRGQQREELPPRLLGYDIGAQAAAVEPTVHTGSKDCARESLGQSRTTSSQCRRGQRHGHRYLC